MEICVLLILFFLYKHYKLYSLKNTTRNSFRYMIENANKDADIGFKTFYIANSCYYWAKYVDFVGIGKKLFWQSTYMIISLIMAIIFAVQYGLANPVTIFGAITAGLIGFTGTCREFSTNVTRQQALINLKHNFCRDMHCDNVDINLIIKWDDMAEQLTQAWVSALNEHINNLRQNVEQYFSQSKKVYIISLLKTKDYKTIIKNICKEKDSIFIFTSGNDKKRYVSKEKLYKEARKYLNDINMYKYELKDAINICKKAYSDRVILIVGSFYVYKTVCEVLKND